MLKKSFHLLCILKKIEENNFHLQDFDFLKRDFEALKLENEGIKHQLEIKDKLIKVSAKESNSVLYEFFVIALC